METPPTQETPMTLDKLRDGFARWLFTDSRDFLVSGGDWLLECKPTHATLTMLGFRVAQATADTLTVACPQRALQTHIRNRINVLLEATHYKLIQENAYMYVVPRDDETTRLHPRGRWAHFDKGDVNAKPEGLQGCDQPAAAPDRVVYGTQRPRFTVAIDDAHTL